MKDKVIIHRFSVSVDCDGELYEDLGVLMLPPSYSEEGNPTRLVICCHGAGGTVETDDSQTERQVLVRYLLANGYAVMDVNGLPKEYARRAGIDIMNNVGSPIAIDCYVKGYEYCITHFNLKSEVLVHGASMGGISSTNLVLSGRVPVIAQSGFCPVLDAYGQIFLHPWSGGLPKTALGIFYRFERNESGELIYDAEKVKGYDPMARCEIADGRETVSYPVPVRFWQSEDDRTVSIESTKRFVSAIRAGGGVAELVSFPAGGHEPQDFGDPVSDPVGNTLLEGERLEIKPAVEGAFAWLTGVEKAVGRITRFYNYRWHDADIEKIEISSNQISIVINHDDYEDPIKILCNDVVGLTDLCMWEDTVIYDARLEYVNDELPPFLQKVKDAHFLDGEFYDNQPIKNNLLRLSIQLVNDIVLTIYCYEVKICEGAV
ncbi:MAG: hypothetical protein E7641_07785 [Ruminococcaceae bacterium]|nr:hypothetical protein [Oscillospiraceae bacterium]